MTRVALYARYSSDNQSEASIEDQFGFAANAPHQKDGRLPVLMRMPPSPVRALSMPREFSPEGGAEVKFPSYADVDDMQI